MPFFFTHTPTTEIYTLSLHDALPILSSPYAGWLGHTTAILVYLLLDRDELAAAGDALDVATPRVAKAELGGIILDERSEEHTSELQSPVHLVCRLLLEKKNQIASILS